MRDPVAEFMEYNRIFARRNAELLRLKVARMAESPFAFFRGTFHLFAYDILHKVHEPLPLLTGDGPEMDIVGDLHSENYGTYKAADGDIHYDVNDFDETTRGRLDLDVCRLAISHVLAAQDRRDSLGDAVAVALAGIRGYVDAVHRSVKKATNHDLDISEKKPSGFAAVDALVKEMAAAKRREFIEKLTDRVENKRHIKRSTHYFNLPAEERSQAVRLLADYQPRHPPVNGHKDYYEIQDVCGRVSGVGSMSRLRYVLLVSGKGDAEGRDVLIEFKESRPSSYDVQRGRDTEPEALKTRAQRVVIVQKQAQAASNHHLGYAIDGDMSFQAREIAPHDARVEAAALKNAAAFADVARAQAAILARIHARAAARAVGPSNPLAELLDADAFCQRVLAFALAYADLARRDWMRFVGARGELDRVSEWAK